MTSSRFQQLSDDDDDENTMDFHSDALRQTDDGNQMKNFFIISPMTSHTRTDSTNQLSTNHRKPCLSQNSKISSPTLHLNKKHKKLYVPLQFDQYEFQGHLDTGAIQNVLSEAELRPI